MCSSALRRYTTHHPPSVSQDAQFGVNSNSKTGIHIKQPSTTTGMYTSSSQDICTCTTHKTLLVFQSGRATRHTANSQDTATSRGTGEASCSLRAAQTWSQGHLRSLASDAHAAAVEDSADSTLDIGEGGVSPWKEPMVCLQTVASRTCKMCLCVSCLHGRAECQVLLLSFPPDSASCRSHSHMATRLSTKF